MVDGRIVALSPDLKGIGPGPPAHQHKARSTWGVMRTPGAVVGPVMPQVTGTWCHERGCEAQSRNYPLLVPCPGHRIYLGITCTLTHHSRTRNTPKERVKCLAACALPPCLWGAGNGVRLAARWPRCCTSKPTGGNITYSRPLLWKGS